jgi:hypothetical protein
MAPPTEGEAKSYRKAFPARKTQGGAYPGSCERFMAGGAEKDATQKAPPGEEAGPSHEVMVCPPLGKGTGAFSADCAAHANGKMFPLSFC